MRFHRGLWAGACLLLALAGCSDDDKTIKDVGVYSPILTGISSDHEPAARGAANQLTAQVTNVNNLPLRYHWRVAAGVVTDSTSATATWTPPDSIGTYDVTVSIEADDGDKHFFKTLTVAMSVDNAFTRWTRSEAIKFDPAPTSGGGVLYAQYRDPVVKSSDAYRVDVPLGAPLQLTTSFFSVTSPSARADQVDIAFTAKKKSTDSTSIFLLPFAGGDTSMTRPLALRRTSQNKLATPRFAPVGTLAAYVTDSIDVGRSGGLTVVHYRNAADISSAPQPILSPSATDQFSVNSVFLRQPSWGPDVNADGKPDSMLVAGVMFVNTPFEETRALYIFSLADPAGATTAEEWLLGGKVETPDWSPDGHYVTFVLRNPGTNDRDIWIINRAAADISAAVRVTSGPADDSQPRFSADGNSIFFISNRVDRYGVTGINGTERRGTNVWSVSEFDRP